MTINKEMLNLRRVRVVLDLRQIDVWAGSGVTPGRLSKAENGKLQLDEVEMTALRTFLAKQWELCQQAEQQICGEPAPQHQTLIPQEAVSA